MLTHMSALQLDIRIRLQLFPQRYYELSSPFSSCLRAPHCWGDLWGYCIAFGLNVPRAKSCHCWNLYRLWDEKTGRNNLVATLLQRVADPCFVCMRCGAHHLTQCFNIFMFILATIRSTVTFLHWFLTCAGKINWLPTCAVRLLMYLTPAGSQ